MTTSVSKDLCIGCGLCPSIAPEVYQMDDDGLAAAIREEVPESNEDKAREAAESCPVDAIDTD